MGIDRLCTPFPWVLYGKKLVQKIETFRSSGELTVEDASAKALRLVVGDYGSMSEGNYVKFYWLVDPEDGVIADAKFQAFGPSALIGGAEAACEVLVGKNYDQARRLSGDILDQHLKGKSNQPAFPEEAHYLLNLILDAIDKAAEECLDIPLSTEYVAPPAPMDVGEVLEGGYPGWDEMGIKKRLAVINDVLDREVRPYIALDGGGVEVLNLMHDREVIITYQGNCTSCFSSVGATLSYIQKMLQAKVHPSLVVVPDMDSLQGNF